MSGPHIFDAAIALQREADGSFAGHTSPAYANMIGPFGGITAAQVLHAVLLHPERLGEPVALTVNFAGPVADGPFTVRPRAARTNRSTQHWTVELLQGDEVLVTATVFTAVRRETWAGHESTVPQVPRPQDVPVTPRHIIELIRAATLRFWSLLPGSPVPPASAAAVAQT